MALVTQIESKIKEEQTVIEKVSTYFAQKYSTWQRFPNEQRLQQYIRKTIKHQRG